jgi:hypothetical protein
MGSGAKIAVIVVSIVVFLGIATFFAIKFRASSRTTALAAAAATSTSAAEVSAL